MSSSGLVQTALLSVAILMSGVVMPAEGKAMAQSDDLWHRVKRIAAYGTSTPQRYRYLGWGQPAGDTVYQGRWPALTQTQRGMLVCLFTRRSKQQGADSGDIVAIYSRDRGETWTEPVVVYEHTECEPRTMGTLTTLASGKLIAAIVEMNSEERPQLVRLLTSEDGGQSWQASAPLDFAEAELQWICPYGRLIEQADGTLLMPVFGESSKEGQEDVGCTGLLRSTDGGQSWGDFSLIAGDPQRSFSGPAVLATGDDSLVALISSSGKLYRCESQDGGYSWSTPRQKLIGREPQLVPIGEEALACVACEGSTWGFIRVSFSYDEGKSWRCGRRAMEHPRHGGYFGHPTGLALDAGKLIVVFAEEERIESVFFMRNQQAAEIPGDKRVIPPDERDRWEYVGTKQLDLPSCFCRPGPNELLGMDTDKLTRSSDGGTTWEQQPLNLPADFRGSPSLLIQLSSGRLVCAATWWTVTEEGMQGEKVIGQSGGYPLVDPDRGAVLKDRVFVIYSDDEGRTWQGTGQPIDISPLDWAVPYGRFIESADGTLSMTVYGCLNEQDTRQRLDCCGIFRSTDGGENWGDFSLVAYDKQRRWTAYNEMDIAVVSDQLWVAFIRTEYRGVPNESAWMSRAISMDGGRTWSQPELCFDRGVPTVEVLPDGGIVVGASGALHFTYNLGRTWTRVAPAGGYAVPFLLNSNTLLVGNWQQLWGMVGTKGGITFDVWRRVSAGESASE